MSNGNWDVDRSASIGSGGFGKVYAATDPNGAHIAAKVIAKAPGADRDLLAVDVPASPHVVPVLNIEESSEELILFMPRAEKSLRDYLSPGKPLQLSDGLDVLEQIAKGLVALEGHIVHRDLKPENILYLEGHWAICDFGISRYAEASTSPDTKKFSMTPPYAAPEQWRHDHATEATDIYAFGVIAHEVLGGSRPFPGPGLDEYRDQHLSSSPPKVTSTKKLAALVHECLFKAPGARPHAQNLLARLASAGVEAKQPGASALADAQQAVVDAAAAAHEKHERQRTEEERRQVLAEAAAQIFEQIVEELEETIVGAAPAAQVSHSGGNALHISIGRGQLAVSNVAKSGPVESPFDVIAYSSITLAQTGSGVSRSHSLYYANFDRADSYEWYELAFCGSFNADFDHEPRALAPGEGLGVLSHSFGSAQLGRPIVSLRLGNLEAFVDEWGQRLGLTAQGKFPRVSRLPEGNPQYPRLR